MSFTNIQIQQFRGIKNCNIQDFGKHINLFVGRNNCGKTSVLDAIFLLFSPAAPRISIDINNFRDCVYTNFHETALLNFYKLDTDNTIRLNAQLIDSIISERNIEIKPVFLDAKNVKFGKIIFGEQLFDDKRIHGLDYVSRFTIDGVSKVFKSTIVEKIDDDIQTVSATMTLPDDFKEVTKVEYIHSKSPFKLEQRILASIIENKKKEIIIQCLKSIDNCIQDITLVGNRVMIDVGLARLMPIEVLGDGVRKALKIILFLYECRDGVLLVDEIDNGLHYSSMPVLWKAIVETAAIFNVQLFATTHNIDSLKALKSVLEETDYMQEQANTVCYRLRHANDDELVAFRYDYEKFGYAIDMDHEIR